MARYQAREAERTGIQGLKVGFNSVHGYFLEVPRGQVGLVPEGWTGRQTLKSAERYITPELEDFQVKVLQAEDRSRELEYRVFEELRAEVAGEVRRIQDTARALARLDCLAGLAEVAARNRYVAPEVDDGPVLEIEEGRHPVIEVQPEAEAFVPNDSLLDDGEHVVTVITGPNM